MQVLICDIFVQCFCISRQRVLLRYDFTLLTDAMLQHVSSMVLLRPIMQCYAEGSVGAV